MNTAHGYSSKEVQIDLYVAFPQFCMCWRQAGFFLNGRKNNLLGVWSMWVCSKILVRTSVKETIQHWVFFILLFIMYVLVEEGALFRWNGLKTKVLAVKTKYMYHLCKKQIELQKGIFWAKVVATLLGIFLSLLPNVKQNVVKEAIFTFLYVEMSSCLIILNLLRQKHRRSAWADNCFFCTDWK